MRELHPRPSLDYLRKEAKELLALVRSGDAEAAARLAAVTTSGRPSLHHAQLALAREYGLKSWRDLVWKVRTTETDGFLNTVCGDRWDTATRIKEAPEPVRMGNVFVAAACGDADALRRHIKEDPRRATAKGGPKDWSPLVYLCFSRLNSRKPVRFAEAGEVLLEAGADANDSFLSPDYPDYPFPVLYGACGVVYNPELAELLIKHGANVNDNESLYHSTETRNHDCLNVLLKQKPKIEGSNAFFRILDFDDIEGLKLFLEAGANPNEKSKDGDNPLCHAIRRGRDTEHLSLLIERGADASQPSKEGWSPALLALRRANLDAYDLLREIDPVQDPRAEFIVACLRDDLQAVHLSKFKAANLEPSDQDALVEAAWSGHTEVVRTMLTAGFPVNHLHTENGQTALHGACWKGDTPTVSAILEFGPGLDIVERTYQATPAQWVLHGSVFSIQGEGRYLNPTADHPAVVRLLFAAGAPFPEEVEGSAAVLATLQELRNPTA